MLRSWEAGRLVCVTSPAHSRRATVVFMYLATRLTVCLTTRSPYQNHAWSTRSQIGSIILPRGYQRDRHRGRWVIRAARTSALRMLTRVRPRKLAVVSTAATMTCVPTAASCAVPLAHFSVPFFRYWVRDSHTVLSSASTKGVGDDPQIYSSKMNAV